MITHLDIRNIFHNFKTILNFYSSFQTQERMLLLLLAVVPAICFCKFWSQNPKNQHQEWLSCFSSISCWQKLEVKVLISSLITQCGVKEKREEKLCGLSFFFSPQHVSVEGENERYIRQLERVIY